MVSIAASVALMIAAGCDLDTTAARLEPDPQLESVAEERDPIPEADCGGRACLLDQVCADNSAGAICIPACDPTDPEDCLQSQVCLEVRPGVTGCYDRCDPFDSEGCPSSFGCAEVGTDRVCVVKGRAEEDETCDDHPDCLGSLVCNRDICRRPCADGAPLGEPGACSTIESCERVTDGFGVCL